LLTIVNEARRREETDLKGIGACYWVVLKKSFSCALNFLGIYPRWKLISFFPHLNYFFSLLNFCFAHMNYFLLILTIFLLIETIYDPNLYPTFDKIACKTTFIIALINFNNIFINEIINYVLLSLKSHSLWVTFSVLHTRYATKTIFCYF